MPVTLGKAWSLVNVQYWGEYELHPKIIVEGLVLKLGNAHQTDLPYDILRHNNTRLEADKLVSYYNLKALIHMLTQIGLDIMI